MVMDLGGVDCFTLLDYVESLRRSILFSEAFAHLKQIRYKDGKVSYRTRNHFFSDWKHQGSPWIEDVTARLGKGRTLTVVKRLNQKDDGSLWLPGIPITNREIEYLPTGKIDQETIDALRTGDYVGIYSDHPGLDVSHTGIVIKTGERTFLRHASSRRDSRRVIDSDLSEYLQGTAGIIVYRPR